MRRNPDLLWQADEVFNNIIYEDDFIICSNNTIANKKNLLNIASFEEIIGIYERKFTYEHFITVTRELVLVTKKGEITISIYAKIAETVENLVNYIYKHCSNVKIGYTSLNCIILLLVILMKNKSIWINNIHKSSGNIPNNFNTDVLIIGGGITGLTTAYFLCDSIKNITLIDRDNIGSGVTSKTTAKVTYLQGNIYNQLDKILVGISLKNI